MAFIELCQCLFALRTGVQFKMTIRWLKCLPVYTLLDFDYNFRIQEIVSSSVFAAANLGTKVKYV
jgi:hypothetical protein